MKDPGKNHKPPAFLFSIAGLACCWFFAGFITTRFSFEYINPASDVVVREDEGINEAVSFYMKAGFIWSIGGGLLMILMPSRAKTAFYRIRSTRSSNPDLVVGLTMVSFALVLGFTGGSALAGWMLPKLDCPAFLIMRQAGFRVILGGISTAVVSLFGVPYALKLYPTLLP